VSQIITGLYFIYGAPFEIIIALSFLYQLLGVSAFAGLLVLVAGWPLNSAVTRRSIAIQRGVLAARDARMGVLSELLGAVKFIKFFAWEDRWIARALGARETEMGWMVKARLNSVLFTLLWTLAPVLVALVSFATFVLSGHDLDVATAFTSLALFAMVRQPLNIIPTYVVQILQTRVALGRIAGFLAEDEVDAQVSSLKPRHAPAAADEGLGFEGASFCWNEVVEKEDKDPKKKGKARAPSESSSLASNDDEPQRFELRDLTLRIPEGKLTVITGPTASGKTALLVSDLSFVREKPLLMRLRRWRSSAR
jgi:ABC-type multidrug transport system fused ATPase/permease subunit